MLQPFVIVGPIPSYPTRSSQGREMEQNRGTSRAGLPLRGGPEIAFRMSSPGYFPNALPYQSPIFGDFPRGKVARWPSIPPQNGIPEQLLRRWGADSALGVQVGGIRWDFEIPNRPPVPQNRTKGFPKKDALGSACQLVPELLEALEEHLDGHGGKQHAHQAFQGGDASSAQDAGKEAGQKQNQAGG
jgi:hypothetical protein